MSCSELFGRELLIFDGAMGTMLQAAGLQPGEKPDLWNITHPETVRDIHCAYLRAGANILKTNTFGCNAWKLAGSGHGSEEVAARAVQIAKNAIAVENETQGPAFVAMDVGPIGRLLSPLGDLDFEEAVALFSAPIAAGKAAGADLVLIETFSDAYELKAAVLAAKEAAPDLPLCATVTLDKRGKLLTGGDVDVVCALMEGLGVDALGLNCGLGPVQMLPILERLRESSSLPLILNPNAGLPREEAGQTVYDLGPTEFAHWMEQAAHKGAWLIGGCCGTTPAHIEAMAEKCRAIVPPKVTQKTHTVACSYGSALYFADGAPALIGERINPTGKPRMKQALRDGDLDLLLREGIRQQEAGAQALDVNAGLPEIDEPAMLCRLVQELQGVCDLPLQIDTADPVAMEKALRIYNGKAIVNSVNGKEAVMEAIFPLVKKYGGVVVALTLDDAGIPETVEGRMEVARRILARAAAYGIPKEAFLFDPLTMAVSAGADNGKVTLACVRRLREELGVRVSLGVSNVSFGLPARERLNTAFFTLAMGAGLSAAIMNPFSEPMISAWRAASTLLGLDANCAAYLAAYGGEAETKTEKTAPGGEMPLHEAVLRGFKQEAARAAQDASGTPMEIIESGLIPALNEAGRRFEQGSLFLPQLLMCAEAAKAAFAVIRTRLGEGASTNRGTVVLATVEGDVHDIGKNIARALLENYCFQVVDLGKDVPAEAVAEAVERTGAKLVGLSALMTTTVPGMARTIGLLREKGLDCRIMCGGAVLTESHALRIGADCYVPDAMASVRYAMEVYGAAMNPE